MRTLLPIFLIVLSGGLFVVYVNPTYQEAGGIKDLQGQAQGYDQALTQSSELRSARDQLLAKRNTFSTDDIRKLERIASRFEISFEF